MAFTPTIYGYREGVRIPVVAYVDSSSGDISVGDHLIYATAGYVKVASAGDIAVGIAMQNVTAPASDGGATVLMDVSEQSIYEAPPDAGTVTRAIEGLTCDYGGSQTINIDASTDDNILIRRVDTAANTVFYSIKLIPAGVV
jgi:hypothetical protein